MSRRGDLSRGRLAAALLALRLHGAAYFELAAHNVHDFHEVMADCDGRPDLPRIFDDWIGRRRVLVRGYRYSDRTDFVGAMILKRTGPMTAGRTLRR